MYDRLVQSAQNRDQPADIALSSLTPPLGGGGFLPSPPWHYSSDFIAVEFRADVDRLRAFLPAPLEPGVSGEGLALFGDWQACADGGAELLDPARAQYREFCVLIECVYDGRTVAFCVGIWVNHALPLFRGWVQGLPKKPGAVWLTRAVSVGRAGPRLGPGGRFAACASVYDRALARTEVTLDAPADALPRLHELPLVNRRYFPAWARGGAAVDEFVFADEKDREQSQVWRGAASLEFFEVPNETLADLRPLAFGNGYVYSLGESLTGGTLA